MLLFLSQAGAPEVQTPIVFKCHSIHHQLLASRDPQLYAHLEAIEILPQLYALYFDLD